mmetsp:Transcript_19121/g.53783  ORF Transcript_19121/g.53783 Transcript_19121/m.53783 type:complete len:81 (-) Transcript_19121:244-486(-)
MRTGSPRSPESETWGMSSELPLQQIAEEWVQGAAADRRGELARPPLKESVMALRRLDPLRAVRDAPRQVDLEEDEHVLRN